MAGHTFFSHIDSSWDSYSPLRAKYQEAIPIPQKNYFKPIRSIDDLSTLAIRPIEKPLWLGVNALSFLVKGILTAAATAILAPCALALAIIAPTSDLCRSTINAFKLTAALSLVSAAMAVVAALSAAIACIMNPVHVVTRAAATVVENLNTTTESCCGLTIANFNQY
ncbi:hypothetical protein [uncultured Legionella sp.]|uniref:hypothetical protein n=1 Tax=uncultured Legionella sp. TaxID=210934 RepID=UPI00262EDC66|nr:hypothetical protein [uncultured Legionella sp.]